MLTAEERVVREKERGKRKRQKFSTYSQTLKSAIGCETCGYNAHPAALQWDHINPETKCFPIAHGKDYSWQKFVDEIAKCRVLCSNCHAIHTHS